MSIPEPSYTRLRELLLELLEADPADQAVRLTELRRSDPVAASELDRLLEAHGAAERDAFMEIPGSPLTIALNTPGPQSSLPEQIGPYPITDLLGQGSSASVYRGIGTPPLARHVAIKVLHASAGEGRERRFLVEQEILAGLNHPNIAQVYSAGHDKRLGLFSVNEYVPGHALNHAAIVEGITAHKALHLVLQVCEAVAHAHNNGVIHRDLKPSNVLVADALDKPIVKVIDFGIARTIESTSTLTHQHGSIIGTLAYMAPEQIQGAALDVRTDIHAVGFLLAELLLGQYPFGSSTTSLPVLMDRILTHPVPTITGQPTAIASDLNAVIAKATAKDPPSRYSSISRLSDDLRRICDGEPVEARPLPRVARFFRRARKHPRTSTLVALAVVLMLLLLGQVLLANAETKRRTTQLEQVLSSLSTDILDEAASLTSSHALRLRLAGLVEANARDIRNGATDRPHLLRLHASTLEALAKAHHDAGDAARSIQPSREALAALELISEEEAHGRLLAQRDAITARIKLGDRLGASGDESGQSQHWTRAHDQLLSLRKAHPTDLGVMDDLCYSYTRITRLTNDRVLQRTLHIQRLQLAEQLYELDPTRTMSSLNIAWSHHLFAHFVAHGQDDFSEADTQLLRTSIERALAHASLLHTGAPENVDFSVIRVLTLRHSAGVLSRLGDDDVAEARYRDAIDLAHKLSEQDPTRKDLEQLLRETIRGSVEHLPTQAWEQLEAEFAAAFKRYAR